MYKKILCVVLALAMVCAFAACGGGSSSGDQGDAKDIKVGVIYIGDENEGYTYSHHQGTLAMKDALGLTDEQVIIKWNIPEGEECYEAAVDLADQGCDIIFANSFGHEDFIIQAAKEYPEVQFCHATGYKAAGSNLDNMHNYFTAVYESRYISGIVAGYKLNELIADGTITKEQAKIGYVGAFSYAEVVSGFTSFFLGVRSVCPDATMVVKYTGSWADQALEKETAEALIDQDCVLIAQHADTTGAATAAEAAKVHDIGYNISMIEAAPNYALTSASINWGPYVTYAVQCVLDDKAIDTDWCKGYTEGATLITEINSAAFSAEAYDEVKKLVADAEAGLKDGTLKVFDTSKFTVGGAQMTTTVGVQGYNDVEYIKDGYFQESTLQSAPSFCTIIDGITELNQVF